MKPSAPSYSSRDLKGLKVRHDQSKFKDGATILTLADRGELSYCRIVVLQDIHTETSQCNALSFWTRGHYMYYC